MAQFAMKTGAFGLGTDAPELQEAMNPEQLRKMSMDGNHPGLRQRIWGLEARMDPTVTFEEYTFWAKIEREMEIVEQKKYLETIKEMGMLGGVKAYFSNTVEKRRGSVVSTSGIETHGPPRNEKEMSASSGSDSPNIEPIAPSQTHDYDAEWRTAARAMRTSGWMTIFYLITTDILGWAQTPYVFANNGYNAAIGIFILFGVAAMCSGLMIWRTFLGLDSSRYPMLSFGDPFFRLFGPTARKVVNVGQAFQMFCTVAVIVSGNSQIMSQINGGHICYIAISIISVIIGIASCGLRALKHVGWICNFAVWINIVTFIIILVVSRAYGPDPTYAIETTILPKTPMPVHTSWGVPPPEYQIYSHNLFAAQFNGINSIVYAFSGALLFVAFLSEMRHPLDFWKGCLMAQVFITVVYVFFGAFVYTYIGQYSVSTISQVVNPLSVQVATNVLSLMTAFLAVFLYFNIGMKVVYLHICQEIFKMPAISTKRGYMFWLILGPMYWIFAWIVAMSVPNFGGLTSVIGGLLSLNFTYSIPGIMYVAYLIQSGSSLPGEGFDPTTGVTTRHDNGMKRHFRGLMKTWYISIPAILFTCGGLASSGMGTWAAIEGLIEVFGPGGTIQTSWGCTGPS